jgi:hypothetical protein
MVESLTMLLQLLVKHAATAVRRDELERPSPYRCQGNAEREETRLAVHLALRRSDGPDVPWTNPERIGHALCRSLEITNEKACVMKRNRRGSCHLIPRSPWPTNRNDEAAIEPCWRIAHLANARRELRMASSEWSCKREDRVVR